MKKKEILKSNGVKDAGAGAKEPKVFANLTHDKVFKIVLGTEGKSERLLKSLLNHVLKFDVEHLRFVPTEKTGKTEEEGESIFDVYCEDTKGRRFLIEMQLWNQKYYRHRASYYMSFAIQDQARKEKQRQNAEGKKWDYYFPPVYEVNFLNYRNDLVCPYENSSGYPFTAHYTYKNEYNMHLKDGSNIYFVDLERFRKSFEECDNDLEKWLFSIKNMHLLEEVPSGVDGTELEELYDEANLAAWPPQKRSNYERIMGHQNDFEICLQEQKEDFLLQLQEQKEDFKLRFQEQDEDFKLKLQERDEEFKLQLQERDDEFKLQLQEETEEARDKGIAIGREEGREEGALKAKTEVAIRMLEEGLDVKTIAGITGLSVEMINSL